MLWFLPAAGVEVLKPYQTARLTGFANPDADPSGLTYNVTQSITAIGAGGLDGRGVREASQTRLDYLPEHATDFVFASFAEQRGFFGASILLLLYLLVVWRGLRVITLAGDLYGAVVAAGIVFGFLFQIFVNVGMTMGIAPVTGIPLAFVSVGGSSMVANLVADRPAAVDPRPRAARRRPMNVLGLSPGMLLRLAREARDGDRPRGPLLVVGPLAAQLAQSAVPREATPGSSARRATLPPLRRSCACSAARRRRSRRRSCVPRRAPAYRRSGCRPVIPAARVPYVLPGDVVVCPPGRGLPASPRSPRAIVSGLGREAAAAGSPPAGASPGAPSVRSPVARRGPRPGWLQLPWGTDEHLPLLVLLQARLLRDLAVASGHPAPSTQQEVGAAVGPELGAALALGLGARSLVRRLPVRSRLVDAAVAGGATLALATAATRLRPL